MAALVGHLASVWRFPVKSLRGECLATALIEARGLVGDRAWALRTPSGKIGSGKTTRRFEHILGLLALRAHYAGAVPVITGPDGAAHRADDEAVDAALSHWLGRPVVLAPEAAVSHFDEGPVSLMTTGSVATLAERLGTAVDPRRFRTNLVIQLDSPSEQAGYPEDAWVGRAVAVGSEVRLEVARALTRCVMVGQAQTDLPADPRILRALADTHGATLGVWARVRRAGTVSLGDPVLLL